MGSFRPVAGSQYLHWLFNFTGRVVETVLKSLHLLTFQHRAGVSPYTSPFGFAETCVFAKQLLEPLLCDHFSWLPFSLSYGVILPSSLTTLLPSACGFSPHLPVSVCGTGTSNTIAAFLDSVDSPTSLLLFSPYHISPSLGGFAYQDRLLA